MNPEDLEQEIYTKEEVNHIVRFLVEMLPALQWAFIGVACLGWAYGILLVYIWTSAMSRTNPNYYVFTACVAQMLFGVWCIFKFQRAYVWWRPSHE